MKFRTFVPALLLCLWLAAFPIACADASFVPGDCSGDGVFDQADAQLVKAYLLGQTELSPEQLSAADLSGDRQVTVTDFLQMQSALTGRISAP